MAKLTKLTPVLIERTCEHCGDGVLAFKETHDDGFHFFKKTKYWYEYECKKCGATIKSDKEFRLREIIFIDEETKKQHRIYGGIVL